MSQATGTIHGVEEPEVPATELPDTLRIDRGEIGASLDWVTDRQTEADVQRLMSAHLAIAEIVKELRILDDAIVQAVGNTYGHGVLITPWGEFKVGEAPPKKSTNWDKVLDAIEMAALYTDDGERRTNPQEVAERFRDAVAEVAPLTAYVSPDAVTEIEWRNRSQVERRRR